MLPEDAPANSNTRRDATSLSSLINTVGSTRLTQPGAPAQ